MLSLKQSFRQPGPSLCVLLFLATAGLAWAEGPQNEAVVDLGGGVRLELV